jgi:hypothetical protein
MLDNMRRLYSIFGNRKLWILLGAANAASAIYVSLLIYPPLSLAVSLSSIILLIYVVSPRDNPLIIGNVFAYTSLLLSAMTLLILLVVR